MFDLARALARPWTLVTCQLVSPMVLEIPAIVGLVFLVEILLKRAYVGSRGCELLLTTAVVTGGLYALFDAFHRTVISGKRPNTARVRSTQFSRRCFSTLSKVEERLKRRRHGEASGEVLPCRVSSRRRVYRRRDR